MNALGTVLAAAAFGAVAGVASAQTSHHGHGTMATTGAAPAHVMDPAALQKMMDAMMPAPGDPESTKELKAADMRMMHDMAVGYTGDPDVDFART
jgi:fructose-1,6-bisphosphatase/sedoheptulose 1,7-bisphosphatase-like protein